MKVLYEDQAQRILAKYEEPMTKEKIGAMIAELLGLEKPVPETMLKRWAKRRGFPGHIRSTKNPIFPSKEAVKAWLEKQRMLAIAPDDPALPVDKNPEAKKDP